MAIDVFKKPYCDNCGGYDSIEDRCRWSHADDSAPVDPETPGCDFWEGNCQWCFGAGEPVFKRLCPDCDWEDEEEYE